MTLALGACATSPATPELAVRERASELWQARVAGNFDKAYGYMPPSYRAITSVERYKAGFGGAVKTTGAEVISVTCETQDKCVTQMKVEARAVLLRGSAPIVTHFDETWVREGGTWWLFPTP
jgi:hypothetical protein